MGLDGGKHDDRGRNRRAGFTLIEILITLTVIGLMFGVVIANMGGVTRNERLRAGARKLAGMSDYVRSKAVGDRRYAYLVIDFDQNRYRFVMDPPLDTLGRHITMDEGGRAMTQDELDEWRSSFSWEALPRDVYFRRLWFNSKQYHEKGTVEIEYQPNGMLSTWILWIQATPEEGEEKGPYFSVMVNGLSGKSEVIEDKQSFASADESDFTSVIGSEIPGGSGK